MRKRFIYIIFVLLFILFSLVYKPAKDGFLFISRPFLIFFNKTGSLLISSPIHFFETLKDINNLSLKNEQLMNEIRKLESEKAALIEVERENQILRRQLDFVKENKQWSLIPAYIIGQAPDLQYLILDKGSQDGVKNGQTVIFEGWLVGKIIEVNPSTSKVFLIINPTSAVPAVTQESRALGLVKGELGYGLTLEDVSKDIPLKKDENVITSGLGGDYPKGLLIGKIKEITSLPADLFQKASLGSLLDFSKLEMVFIIK